MTILNYQPGNLPCELAVHFPVDEHADLHMVAEGGSARASLWWNATPSLPGEATGCIGHFFSDHAGAGTAVLEACLDRLAVEGCTMVLGPINGTTWRRYRFVTGRGSEPAFFMEPDNPDDWPAIFEQAGFVPLANYTSSIVTDPDRADPRVDRAWGRLKDAGVTIRCLDPGRFESDLNAIYDLSVVSFAHNFLYSPIGRADFLAQYVPYRERIDPRFVLLAEREGACVGYLFAIPDFNEALRGEPVRTIVGKTLAILPGRSLAGLGLVLVSKLHRRAVEAGFRRVIHALQHESNGSRNLTAHFGGVMRRYTLFAKKPAR